MWPFLALALSCELVVAAYSSFRRGMESAGKREYQVQHGACSYTFLLPEVAECRPPAGAYVSNAVQRDAPLDYDDSVQRLQVLENILENNTQWLMKVGLGRAAASLCSPQRGRGRPGMSAPEPGQPGSGFHECNAGGVGNGCRAGAGD